MVLLVRQRGEQTVDACHLWVSIPISQESTVRAVILVHPLDDEGIVVYVHDLLILSRRNQPPEQGGLEDGRTNRQLVVRAKEGRLGVVEGVQVEPVHGGWPVPLQAT